MGELPHKLGNHILISHLICNVYNMSGRVVSDIQTRAEGESLYIRYNTDANVVNNLKNRYAVRTCCKPFEYMSIVDRADKV
jgi:hypothetical protein